MITIKNKGLRFLASFITILFWFLIASLFYGDENVLKTMLVSVFYLFYLTVPIQSFAIYKLYILFTPKGERTSKKTKGIRLKAILFGFMVIVLLLSTN